MSHDAIPQVGWGIEPEVSMCGVVQEKCRLPVGDGVVLMGVFDETGTLPSGTFWASWEAPLDDTVSPAPAPPSIPFSSFATDGWPFHTLHAFISFPCGTA
jgi:hypothetical protein